MEVAATESTAPPLLEITSCPVATANKKMVIAGVVHFDRYGCDAALSTELQVYINSEEHKIHKGKFMVSLPLEDGANEFEIVITDIEGVITREKRTIFCGFLPPTLQIEELPDVTARKAVTIMGMTLDINQLKSVLTLKINNEVVAIDPADGHFAKVCPLNVGSNRFDIIVYDGGLRKTAIHKLIEHHPLAPEITFEGMGPVITSHQLEAVGHLSNYDPAKTEIRIHNKAVTIADDSFCYRTSIRTDKAEIPVSIDLGGRRILSFTRQVVFLPSPPTITIDDEIKQMSSTHCRISGTISDENDANPRISVDGKAVSQRLGAWMATLTLVPGINTIVIEGRNQAGLKKVIKKKIFVPE